MRLKTEVEGKSPLGVLYEYAILCCLNLSGAPATVGEVSQYMWSACGLRVSPPAVGQALKRMEAVAYVSSPDKKRPIPFSDHKKGPTGVKVWDIINPGRATIAQWKSQHTIDGI